MDHLYSIKYNRIELRPMSFVENEKYCCIRNDEKVRMWFGFKNIISMESQQQWYQEYRKNEKDLMFSIFYGGSKFVGGVSLYDIDIVKREAELGRLVVRHDEEHIKGLGVEAVNAVSILAKEKLRLQTLKLEVYKDNIAAVKTYFRSDFVFVSEESDMDGKKIVKMLKNLD